MTKTWRSDERDEPSIDALDTHSRALLFSTLGNDRRPVAVVGSGLSVVYGGVSWEESVRRCVRYAIDRIEQTIGPPDDNRSAHRAYLDDNSSAHRVYLDRQRYALNAFNNRRAISQSSEKYVALDLCSQALNYIDEIEEAPACKLMKDRGGESSFRAFMANLYKDDTHFIRQLLIERFGLPEGGGVHKARCDELTGIIWALEPEAVQRLAASIYSAKALHELVDLIPQKRRAAVRTLARQVMEDIEKACVKLDFPWNGVLPVDRRSTLVLFLCEVPTGPRLEFLGRHLGTSNSGSTPTAPSRPILDPIARLQQALRVKRYVTLNFDYTLEQRVILEDIHVTGSRPIRLETAKASNILTPDGETGGLTRRFPDGLVASTDIYHRKAVGRVFEFALDSVDFRAQILHLHGRADDPKTMLLTDTDSNRQYRRDRASRTTLEQALDVILTGNPVVFVGIGLSEAEITRALRDLVSRGYPTAYTPVFAIMAADQPGTTTWRRQIALFQQYGIHVLHAGLADENWAGLAKYREGIEALRGVVADFHDLVAGSAKPRPSLSLQSRRKITALMRESDLRDTLCGDRLLFRRLASRILALARSDESKIPDEYVLRSWGDYLDKLQSKLYTYSMLQALDDVSWGIADFLKQRRLPKHQDSKGNLEFAPQADFALPQGGPSELWENSIGQYRVRESAAVTIEGESSNGGVSRNFWRHQPERAFDGPNAVIDPIVQKIADSRKPIVTCFSPLGAGKGTLIAKLHKTYRDASRYSLIVNCNFGIEFDSALRQSLDFLVKVLPGSALASMKQASHQRAEAIRALVESLQNPEGGKEPPKQPAVLVLSGLERLIDRRGKPVAPELDLMLTALLHASLVDQPWLQLVIVGADGCKPYVDGKIADCNPPAAEKEDGRRYAIKVEPDLLARDAAGTGTSFIVKQAVTAIGGNTLAENVDDIPWDLEKLDARLSGFLGHLLREAEKAIEQAAPENPGELLRELKFAASRSARATVPNSARSRAIEAVMRVVLDHWHLLAFAPRSALSASGGASKTTPPSPDDYTRGDIVNRLRAQLDQHVLATLAFIGMPIEEGTLDHMNTPNGLIEQIARRIDDGEVTKAVIERERKGTIGRLQRFGFVIVIRPHPAKAATDPKNRRIVLHRSAMAEMRERIGVRSGDELLSNSFSTTLALSMPTDLVVPEEPTTHELKATVGRLRGAWRDPVLASSEWQKQIEGEIRRLRDAIGAVILGSPFHAEEALSKFDVDAIKVEGWLRMLDRALRMATTDMQTNIRAAAGVIRGFFSAATLVAQMPTKTEREDRELGEFEEHKRRIGHVLNRFREAQRAVPRARRYLNNVRTRFAKIEAGSAKAELAASLAAIEGLIKSIEDDPASQESRNIPALYGAELVWLLNEQSVIALLQGDLYEAQRGFREASEANTVFRNHGHGQVWRRIEINRSLLRIERGRIAEARAQLEVIRREIETTALQSPHERALTLPLVESYIGLCDHMGGSYSLALQRFKDSIDGLIKTDQQRALAVTYVRRAALQFGLGDAKAGIEDIRSGTAIAEAGRQMDILWRARLTGVRGMDPHRDIKDIMTIFRESRRYATVMQLPRIEIHALRAEAEFYLNHVDDYEYAAVLASEAMTIATKCGMVLQRISLRVLMGRILLRRDDMSGHHLLQRAIAHADRVGYQLQVDRAQRALLNDSLRKSE